VLARTTSRTSRTSTATTAYDATLGQRQTNAFLEAAQNPFSKAINTQQPSTWKLDAAHIHGVVPLPRTCQSTIVQEP